MIIIKSTFPDVAMPGVFRVVEKENEKITKYQELAEEMNEVWNTRTKMIPIEIGALGTEIL